MASKMKIRAINISLYIGGERGAGDNFTRKHYMLSEITSYADIVEGNSIHWSKTVGVFISKIC